MRRHRPPQVPIVPGVQEASDDFPAPQLHAVPWPPRLPRAGAMQEVRRDLRLLAVDGASSALLLSRALLAGASSIQIDASGMLDAMNPKPKLRRVVLTLELDTTLTVKELRGLKRVIIESGAKTVDHPRSLSQEEAPALVQAQANAVRKP
jgi:hypothetical protein